jgi:TFIIF-interacting CTD phosphatase-like protein
VARIADEHGDEIRALMAVDGRESHLAQHNRSAYRPADHSRTISISQRKDVYMFYDLHQDDTIYLQFMI